MQVEGVFGFPDDGEDGDGVFAVVVAVFEVFLFVGGIQHRGGARCFNDEFAGVGAAEGDDGALQVEDGEFERAGLPPQWLDVGDQRRLVHVAHRLAQDAGLFEGLPGADGDSGAGQLQGVVEGVVDAGVEDFAEVVGEVLPAECGDDGGRDDGGGEDAPAVVKAEAALFFVTVVARAADDLPQGDEDEDDETGDGDVDEGKLAALQRLAAHRRLTEAVDAVQRQQDEDGADEDDAGAACFALAADLVGCQGNGGGGVGQGQVSRHLGFQAG